MKVASRKALRKWYRRGDLQEIAEKADVKYNTLQAWFEGRSNNPFIEAAAKAMAKKRKAEIIEIKESK